MAMPSRNVAHSKAATLELPTIESGDYDIFLIQEPYLIEGQVAGLPLGWCTILEENGSALIAVNNPQLALQDGLAMEKLMPEIKHFGYNGIM
ncbi:hypothetical protein CDAR_312741 [Caerostris darwini]|uniref:Uncharacterized protein n=1 Tax=Caerostris darwini TaxID=1538125 RepID=A0AAV4MCL4_9ARAC|nr:hypothetical protein CDAR_312741 [Caerostris darwini]